ncbi:hypothetical protein [Tunturiibacter gelidiferens]|uniref:ATP-binding protein n=1 Tax=Tunturiibacter gelidiferens TaxID=3069689 RepID=A0AAU7YXR2_9BACT
MAITLQDGQESPSSLSERILIYCNEVQMLIDEGVEHPRYEFKRTLTITRENLNDRLDFVKLVQGLANADLPEEKFIIIGGDPKERKFYSVSNGEEFDEAALSSVLAKYLDPLPRMQVFNNLQTANGSIFVLIVLDAIQARPILIKTEGQRSDGKARLQVGEIWIKKNTSLKLASRIDIDQMYKQKIEEEAEDRARKRFRQYSELAGSAISNVNPRARLPVREMLVEPEGTFRRFVEELIVENDGPRFRMLLEIIREALIEGWDRLDLLSGSKPQSEEAAEIEIFFRDQFLPSLRSLVVLGLLLIKYGCDFEWLNLSVDVLLETFETSKNLQPLKAVAIARESTSLQWWRPGFEVFLGFRCLAAYAVARNRLAYLGALLPRFAERMDFHGRQELSTPMLFWPIPSVFEKGELDKGRSTFYWQERISSSWGHYFGNYDRFINASCQLEFIIEFNSFLGVNAIHNAVLKRWLEQNAAKRSFLYNPDFFAYSLHLTVPMAEQFCDFIATRDIFPTNLTVEQGLFNSAFQGKTPDQRLVILGQFLDSLQQYQRQSYVPTHFHFVSVYSWEGRLADLVMKYKNAEPPSATK